MINFAARSLFSVINAFFRWKPIDLRRCLFLEKENVRHGSCEACGSKCSILEYKGKPNLPGVLLLYCHIWALKSQRTNKNTKGVQVGLILQIFPQGNLGFFSNKITKARSWTGYSTMQNGREENHVSALTHILVWLQYVRSSRSFSCVLLQVEFIWRCCNLSKFFHVIGSVAQHVVFALMIFSLFSDFTIFFVLRVFFLGKPSDS